MVDKLPPPLERPDVYDEFDGTPLEYQNPVRRTAHVQRLMKRKQQGTLMNMILIGLGLIAAQIVIFIVSVVAMFSTMSLDSIYAAWGALIGVNLIAGTVVGYALAKRIYTVLVPVCGLLGWFSVFTLIEFVFSNNMFGHADPDGSGLMGAGLEMVSLPQAVLFACSIALGRWIRARRSPIQEETV